MEALSPRDANAHIRSKSTGPKPKPAPAKSHKDHPPAPPAEVREPASSDRRHGAIYHTGRLLGRGGFAICYEGQLAQTTQVYALKIVKSQMAMKKMEQKFQTELQIHSKMKHPNIVRFHRAFSFEKATYLVLELCPNASLMDMVRKRKFVTEPEVRFWTVQMAGAIKYMHAKGIIHRDLKMGNIFLDKNMNVKIGDFGLAALLMSNKDISACRRTTLCGTPNYIAPEILEKGRNGHDYAVDVWALGIIIFALLTGKPPFQSETADEIYRRARELDYDWPNSEATGNFVSSKTKDLVSKLLSPPDMRLAPDAIVIHPFFTCGYVPTKEDMVPELCHSPPTFRTTPVLRVKGRVSVIDDRNLKTICLECEVGPWAVPKKQTSTYKEVAAEEKAGLTPAVPLPENVVYRPFDEWLLEQASGVLGNKANSAEASKALNKVLEPLSPSRINLSASIPTANKLPTQSFAAQQRARLQPPAARTTSRTTRALPEVEREPKRSTASTDPIANQVTNSTSRRTRPLKTVEVPEADPIDHTKEPARGQSARAGHFNLFTQKPTVSEVAPSPKRPASLFRPHEQIETVSGTRPDEVLQRLSKLHAELERALNSRSTAVTPRVTPTLPTIVVKWVDYTNKFGLGYILSNGSVGCIFKETSAYGSEPTKEKLPPSCVVIRDAETHLQNRYNEAYRDRLQVVPVSGPNIEFYENRGAEGIALGKVNPQKFSVPISSNGEAAKLGRGQDDWDNRKREKIVLWKKFANYMTAFGKDQQYSDEDPLGRAALRNQSESVTTDNVITFYQRFGDVGCWAFCDGHLQFNFPDHTKIILSADGTWCDFYHLPLEAAVDLAMKGTLPSSALDERQHLSYPLQTLLNFLNKPTRTLKTTTRKRPQIDPMVQGIPEANDFRRKIEFIRTIVKEWVKNGGLGNSNMDAAKRLRWTGNRELVNVTVPFKHVWVTVGAKNGDDRRVAWFDPRRPDDIVEDIIAS